MGCMLFSLICHQGGCVHVAFQLLLAGREHRKNFFPLKEPQSFMYLTLICPNTKGKETSR
jgi:hypothetical protein